MTDKNKKIEEAVIVAEAGENKVEATAQNEIQKFNLADSSIAALKKKFKGLKVKNRDDASGILAVSAAYREVSKVRTSLENKRKEIKAPYIAIGKQIDDEAKRLTALILEVEKPLEIENNKVKEWEKEAEEKAAKEKAERLENRLRELKTSGLVFDGVLYSINDISIDVVAIEKMSDADYNFLLAKVQIEKKKNDDAAEEARLNAEKEAAEAAKEAAKQKEIAEENERKTRELEAEILEVRGEKLISLGFKENAENRLFIFHTEYYERAEKFENLVRMSAAEFKNHFADLEHEINLLGDKYTEYKKAADIEQKRKDEEAKKAADEAAAKAEAERLERMPDLEKITNYLDEVLAVKMPTVKSETANKIVSVLAGDLAAVIKKARAGVNQLL